MPSQLFKKDIDISIFYNLLEKIAIKNDKYYCVDINVYKKMIYNEFHIEFMNYLEDFYFDSKTFYVTRKITYKSFTNVLRQICNNADIKIDSSIKYNESKYNIEFKIYI